MSNKITDLTAAPVNKFIPIIVGEGTSKIWLDKNKTIKGNFKFSYIWYKDELVVITESGEKTENGNFNKAFEKELKERIAYDIDIYPEIDIIPENMKEIKMNYDENPPWMYGKFWIGSWTMDFWTNGINQQICSEWNSLSPIPACFSMGKNVKEGIEAFYDERIKKDKLKKEKRKNNRTKVVKGEILAVEN